MLLLRAALKVCIALPLDYQSPVADETGRVGPSASVAHAAPLAPRPPQQQVFAFLPLRSYGLRLIVQVG